MAVLSERFLEHLLRLLVLVAVEELLRLNLQSLYVVVDAALQARLDVWSALRSRCGSLSLRPGLAKIVNLLVAFFKRQLTDTS